MIMVGVAVMDVRQFGAKPMIGKRMSFGAILRLVHPCPIQQNGLPREPALLRSRARNAVTISAR
jgi:hypothetical protein